MRVAALIWIVFGSCNVLVAVAILVRMLVQSPQVAGILGLATVLLGLFALLFSRDGVSVLGGRGRRLLEIGIGSLVYGLLVTASGGLSLLSALACTTGGAARLLSLLPAGSQLLCAAGLVVAGLMAISSLTRYQQWRDQQATNGPRVTG
jgi:hypothetical protein